MISAYLITLGLLLAPLVVSKEIPNPPKLEIYESGQVHNTLMAAKNAAWAKHAAAGAYNSTQYHSIAGVVPCVNGRAGEFRCNKIDLYHFSSHAQLGSTTGQGSSTWGWTKNGREFIIIAQADGAAFAEVTKTGQLDYLGRLPNTAGSQPAIWRELRVLDHYVIIGSEAVNHHVQIFDLEKILTITRAQKPKTFDSVTDLTGLFKGLPVGRTHNIVIDHERKYAISVGSQPRTHEFKSGLVFIDLKDPSNPTLAGVQAEDGYVHELILPYRGPDKRYQGITIAYGYNEDTLTIYNVTNPSAATIISRTGYDGASYTHQGWVLDPNKQEFLLLDDEYDEVDAAGPAADGFPVTYIWDIRDLENPKQTGLFKSPQYGIDHNQYIANGKAYQSHYGAGLRILDVSSIPSDPTGKGVKEVAFFDVYPENDNLPNQGSLEFVGTWASYALFKSGYIVINTIERGAFVVRYTGK